jgi:hypothetical protein
VRTRLWYLGYYLSQYVAWPPFYLLWVLPHTLYRLGRDVIQVEDDPCDPILAYAYATASLQTWYLRIAKEVRRFGSNGYVYEDGLGSAIGDRFFHHILSYGILFGRLGPRRYAILSGAILLGSIVALGVLSGQVWLGLGLALLVAGSPAFIMSLLHLSKPENLGWALLPATAFFIARGDAFPAALGLLLLSITSITMVVPAALMAGVLWLTGVMHWQTLVIIGLPTGVKVGWQMVRFLRRVSLAQFFEVLGGTGQNRTMTAPGVLRYLRTIVLAQKIWSGLHLGLAAILLASGTPWGHALALASPVALLVLNYRLFRWADQNTFGRIYLALALVYGLLYPSWVYLGALCVVLFAMHPRLVMEAGGLNMDYVPGGQRLSRFPFTTPIRLGRDGINQVLRFLSPVADGSRVIWEALEPFGKEFGGFRHFNTLAEWLQAERGLEILPGEWLRSTQTDWYVERWAHLRSPTPAHECTAICQEVGAQYVLASTESFVEDLVAEGYRVLGCLTPDVLQPTCLGEVMTPEKNLYLLEVPVSAALIEPSTNLDRQPNLMSFEGQAGIPYFIKYNYHSEWSGSVGEQSVVVEKARVGYLDGMQVMPPVDGRVALRFRPGWLL